MKHDSALDDGYRRKIDLRQELLYAILRQAQQHLTVDRIARNTVHSIFYFLGALLTQTCLQKCS